MNGNKYLWRQQIYVAGAAFAAERDWHSTGREEAHQPMKLLQADDQTLDAVSAFHSQILQRGSACRCCWFSRGLSSLLLPSGQGPLENGLGA